MSKKLAGYLLSGRWLRMVQARTEGEGKLMKEIPILFSTPMVQAILAGNKTMTRRVIKPQPPAGKYGGVNIYNQHIIYPDDDSFYDAKYGLYKCPYGQPGDKLWVQETFRESFKHAATQWEYRVDTPRETDAQTPFNWSHSIHMPKSAARIWLEVVSVRVERLQDITYDDCLREGMWDFGTDVDTLAAFQELWQNLNAKRGFGWDINSWVWVVSFKRLEVAA